MFVYIVLYGFHLLLFFYLLPSFLLESHLFLLNFIFFIPLCLSRVFLLSSFSLHALISKFTPYSCADRAHSCTKHSHYGEGSHTLLSPNTVAQLIRASANDIRPFAQITHTDAQNIRTAARDIHSAGYIFLLRQRAFA